MVGAVVIALWVTRKMLKCIRRRSEQNSIGATKRRADGFDRWNPRPSSVVPSYASTALPPTIKRYAAQGEERPVLQWLASNRGRPDAADADGRTALHHACEHGRSKLARQLLGGRLRARRSGLARRDAAARRLRGRRGRRRARLAGRGRGRRAAGRRRLHPVRAGGGAGPRGLRAAREKEGTRHARGRDHRREPDAPPEPQRDVGRCMMCASSTCGGVATGEASTHSHGRALNCTPSTRKQHAVDAERNAWRKRVTHTVLERRVVRRARATGPRASRRPPGPP